MSGETGQTRQTRQTRQIRLTRHTRLHVEAEETARAGPEALWELLVDAGSYARWGPWSEAGYETPGDSVTRVGALRRLRLGRTVVIERIEDADPGARMVYTVVKGIPVRNYRAEVLLTPAADGTRIHWSADWDRTLLGHVVHRRLQALYPGIVHRLSSAAEALQATRA
jgi:hypothetical protein